jgi:hypothetical protein
MLQEVAELGVLNRKSFLTKSNAYQKNLRVPGMVVPRDRHSCSFARPVTGKGVIP